MEAAIVSLLFFAFGIVLVNGFAAGAAAALYLWRRQWSRGRRNFLSVSLTGLVLVLMTGSIMISSNSGALESGFLMSFLFIFFGGGGAVVSLPGAIAMTRKIERGPSYGDTFE